MHIESILRRLQPQPGFVYGRAEWEERGGRSTLLIHVTARKGARAVCSRCGQKRPGYDVQKEPRRFTFVPLWAIAVLFVYAMRRVNCSRCGVVVEAVPWASGKSQSTHAYIWFIASWARSLSWSGVARRFDASWDTVFRCIEHAVKWGLEHRSLDGIESLGVDELSWKHGQKYLTLVYQIDHGHRRLLHIAKDRTTASFESFFDMLGEKRTRLIRFVASDMWRAFINVVRKRCSDATHVLDRFHVAQLLSKAVDQVRRDEVRRLRADGRAPLLTKTRWILLKHSRNLRRKERGRLSELMKANLRTVRAYVMKEDFQHLWTYTTSAGAGRFLKRWTTMALRSRIPQFRTLATTLRRHQSELLNWFLARGSFAAGATEGFNNKARITTRMAYGFRTYLHAEIALYHRLGSLPEPDWLTHRFC